MRNVASKRRQSDGGAVNGEAAETAPNNNGGDNNNKWNSLPALNIDDKQGLRSDEEADPEQNEDEGLQEVRLGWVNCEVQLYVVPHPVAYSPLYFPFSNKFHLQNLLSSLRHFRPWSKERQVIKWSLSTPIILNSLFE